MCANVKAVHAHLWTRSPLPFRRSVSQSVTNTFSYFTFPSSDCSCIVCRRNRYEMSFRSFTRCQSCMPSQTNLCKPAVFFPLSTPLLTTDVGAERSSSKGGRGPTVTLTLWLCFYCCSYRQTHSLPKTVFLAAMSTTVRHAKLSAWLSKDTQGCSSEATSLPWLLQEAAFIFLTASGEKSDDWENNSKG